MGLLLVSRVGWKLTSVGASDCADLSRVEWLRECEGDRQESKENGDFGEHDSVNLHWEEMQLVQHTSIYPKYLYPIALHHSRQCPSHIKGFTAGRRILMEMG